MIPITVRVWGTEYDVTRYLARPCDCDRRRAECPRLPIVGEGGLEHLCWRVAHAHGNAHRDRLTGLWWVEWHFDWCCSIETHFADDGYQPGRLTLQGRRIELKEYTDWKFSDERTHRERLGEAPRRGWQHCNIKLPYQDAKWATARGVAILAEDSGRTEAETDRIVKGMLGGIIAAGVASRTVFSLNHERTEQYEAVEMLRLHDGGYEMLKTVQDEPQPKIRFVRGGQAVELETGSHPALQAFKGEPPLADPFLDAVRERLALSVGGAARAGSAQ